MMEENMARRKTALELAHPNAAGIDIGEPFCGSAAGA
jgi:hypothetical protein